MKKSRRLYAVTAAGLCLTLAAGGAGYHFLNVQAKENENKYREVSLQHGDLKLTFTGEGTTAGSVTGQQLNIDLTENDLIVEEVYVTSGDEVKAGDALYKLTEDSIAQAEAYYEEAVEDAEKAEEQAKEAYESGKAEAEYNLASAQTSAQTAESVYEASNSSLDQDVADAQAALQNARTQITAYQNNLDQNTYYTDAGVAEKKETLEAAEKLSQAEKKSYEEAKNAYDAAVEAINTKITELEQTVVNSSDASEDITAITKQIKQLAEEKLALEEKKTKLALAEGSYQSALEEKEKAQSEYDSAYSTYEKAATDASAKKETLENSIASLERAYTSAVNAAKTGKVGNQNIYDTTVLEGEYADVVYDSAVESCQSALDEAKDALETLKEEQAVFLALENGVITADETGKIAAVMYESGDVLEESTPLISYSDTDSITVAVEVSQENIAKVNVGDSVEVYLTGMRRESQEGTVTKVASEATSGRSMSNVTYTVEIGIDNSEGSIEENQSAYAVFCYGEIEDADYIETDALSHLEESQAEIRRYNAEGEPETVSVTIGDSTDQHTVILDGIDTEDICLIEMGGAEKDETEP